jgi:hypothetical protein
LGNLEITIGHRASRSRVRDLGMEHERDGTPNYDKIPEPGLSLTGEGRVDLKENQPKPKGELIKFPEHVVVSLNGSGFPLSPKNR